MGWSNDRGPLAGPARQGDASTVPGPGARSRWRNFRVHSASLRYPPITGAEARFDTPPAVVVRRPAVIPERYTTREKDGMRTLECDEAPRIRVVIDPGMAASRSDASSLGERVILLDGAGTFGPLLDGDRKLFNLDHHSGCERLFTLATCEQALLLVHSGLRLVRGRLDDLRERPRPRHRFWVSGACSTTAACASCGPRRATYCCRSCASKARSMRTAPSSRGCAACRRARSPTPSAGSTSCWCASAS